MIENTKIIISHNKVVFTFISSSFTSLILSFFLNVGLLSIPFYVYGVFVLILAYLLYFKKITFQNVIIPKVALDLIFTTYWSTLYLCQTKNLLFYLLPAIVLILYGRFNLFSFKSDIIRIFLLIYMIVNGVIPMFVLGFHTIGILGLSLYMGTGVYSLYLFNESLKYQLQLEPDVNNIINRMAAHDINNIIEMISFIKDFGARVPDEISKMLLNSILVLDNVKQLLKCGNNPVTFQPNKILKIIIEPNMKVSVNDNVIIYFPISLFISIVKNVYSNSSKYANDNDVNFKLNIYNINEDTICFEDNCGGKLDINDIKRKRSSKSGPGHGVFLYSLFYDKEQYNIDTKFENYENGVRLYITFPIKKD